MMSENCRYWSASFALVPRTNWIDSGKSCNRSFLAFHLCVCARVDVATAKSISDFISQKRIHHWQRVSNSNYFHNFRLLICLFVRWSQCVVLTFRSSRGIEKEWSFFGRTENVSSVWKLSYFMTFWVTWPSFILLSFGFPPFEIFVLASLCA